MTTLFRYRRGQAGAGLFLALVLGGLGMTAVPLAQAQKKETDKTLPFQRSNPKTVAAFRPVVTKPGQSTLRVLRDGKDAALGTVVAPDGWLLTKASELKGKITCKLPDGKEVEPRVVGVHELHDLALLKLEVKGLTPIQWTPSKEAGVGNWVASVGTGADPVAIGVVSVATRNVPTRGAPPPSNLANSGYLGIGLDPTSESGAKIGQVLPGGAAEKAGLKASDIILAVNGKEVEDGDDLIMQLQATKPGQVVALKIKRGDQEMELKATLGKRPNAGRADFQNSLGSELSSRRTGFPTILQHDSVIKPTDCGGPLVDLDGKVVGLNIARAGRTESYALPSEVVTALLPDLKSGKLAPKPEKPPEPAKDPKGDK